MESIFFFNSIDPLPNSDSYPVKFFGQVSDLVIFIEIYFHLYKRNVIIFMKY